MSSERRYGRMSRRYFAARMHDYLTVTEADTFELPVLWLLERERAPNIDIDVCNASLESLDGIIRCPDSVRITIRGESSYTLSGGGTLRIDEFIRPILTLMGHLKALAEGQGPPLLFRETRPGVTHAILAAGFNEPDDLNGIVGVDNHSEPDTTIISMGDMLGAIFDGGD